MEGRIRLDTDADFDDKDEEAQVEELVAQVRVTPRFRGLLLFVSLCILSLVAYAFCDLGKFRRENTNSYMDQAIEEELAASPGPSPKPKCYLTTMDMIDLSDKYPPRHQRTAVADKPTQLQRQQREEALQENRRELKLIKDDRNRVRLERDLKRTAARVKAGYCGMCYGGTPPESGCCNTCTEVQESYARRGWTVVNPDSVEQCVNEAWLDKVQKASDAREAASKVGVKFNKPGHENCRLSPGESTTDCGNGIRIALGRVKPTVLAMLNNHKAAPEPTQALVMQNHAV